MLLYILWKIIKHTEAIIIMKPGVVVSPTIIIMHDIMEFLVQSVAGTIKLIILLKVESL